MNDIISIQVLHWSIFCTIFFILSVFLIGKIQYLAKLCIRSIVGTSIIFMINCLLYKAGIFLGLNLFTVVFSGLLGIPGIILMYGFLIIF